MENFFIENEFCHDLEDLIRIRDLENDDAIINLNDDWSCSIELSILEPMIKVTLKSIFKLLFDSNEERFSDNESDDKNILKALKESIDFEKLNLLIPKYYYPSNKKEIVTKQDLIDFIS